MLSTLKPIVEIQELDMQMMQLMGLKEGRKRDLANIEAVKSDLKFQITAKEHDISDLKKIIRVLEEELTDVKLKLKKLQGQQGAIKKVEEFNALSHEMSQAERDRAAKEQRISDQIDRLNVEEDVLKTLKESLETTAENSKVLAAEIQHGIDRINVEGRELKQKRDELVQETDPEVFRIYDRLLRNKRDRVVVPVENRCCSGCHILLTAQDENLVRKGERLVFCEHCSRIHYWPESVALEGSPAAAKPRRRRSTKV